MLPVIINQRFNIKLPSALEIIIFLFIFASEILGEVGNFYGYFRNWDTILHTTNGFLCAAIGFSLIDILNSSEKFHTIMSPIFVALVAFCFSMTVGVLWEFFEFGMDTILKKDMQKDEILTQISSVELNQNKENKPVVINNIEKTLIYSRDDEGEIRITQIDGGYLDIGIRDTIEDLIVNFIGAVVFSVIGWFYIKNRDEYKFAEKFMPIKKTEQEIAETKKEVERLEKILETKKRRKRVKKLKKKEERELNKKKKFHTKNIKS